MAGKAGAISRSSTASLETVEKIEDSGQRLFAGHEEDRPRPAQARGFPAPIRQVSDETRRAFLALEDISDNLPRYDESVLSADMDQALQQAYERLEEDIRSAMKEHRGNKSLMSILLNTLLLYPDHPYDFDEIWARAFDPQTREYVKFRVTVPENLPREALYAKERALIADLKEETSPWQTVPGLCHLYRGEGCPPRVWKRCCGGRVPACPRTWGAPAAA